MEIDFEEWFRQTLASHESGTAAAVPCGSCTACCTSSYFVHVRAHETETLAHIPQALLFDAPGLPGDKVMGFDTSGRCPMLGSRGCSIYERRPETCRTYDCRIHSATGIKADRPAIAERAAQWKFRESGSASMRRLQELARFVAKHRARFPDGLVPQNAPQLAYFVLRLFARNAPLDVDQIVSIAQSKSQRDTA